MQHEIEVREVRVYPHAKEIARTLGYRSVSELCRAHGLPRLTLYRALDGIDGARRIVTERLGPSVAFELLKEHAT